MTTLILIIIFGLGFGYFATQNTTDVVIHFLGYSTISLPIYLIILVSIGIGVLTTIVINLVRMIATNKRLGKKEKQLERTESEVSELTKKVHKLELENTKLETELGKEDTDENAI